MSCKRAKLLIVKKVGHGRYLRIPDSQICLGQNGDRDDENVAQGGRLNIEDAWVESFAIAETVRKNS